MFIKEINNKEIYDEIKNNINKFIDYFKIETYKEFEQFKQKYIDINPKKIENNLISNELSEINKSSYSSKCILASYKVLIDKVFKDPKYIYINLLLFLQKYISNENKLLKNIIENELDSTLCSNEIKIKKNINNIIDKKKKKIHSTKTLNFHKYH